MIRNKIFSVAVVLVCVVAFAAGPSAAWAGTPGPARAQGEDTFSLAWLSAAWSWFVEAVDVFGAEGSSLDQTFDASGLADADPISGDGGTNNCCPPEGGEAGPGIDPDGKP